MSVPFSRVSPFCVALSEDPYFLDLSEFLVGYSQRASPVAGHSLWSAAGLSRCHFGGAFTHCRVRGVFCPHVTVLCLPCLSGSHEKSVPPAPAPVRWALFITRVEVSPCWFVVPDGEVPFRVLFSVIVLLWVCWTA